jgi:hypothetical protein
MTEELQQKLYDKYPEIFQQKYLLSQEACMGWGICVGSGWFNILDVLCFNIQAHMQAHPDVRIQVVQVKEKFGTLHFYYASDPDNYIAGLVCMACGMSARTCEMCGAPGKAHDDGWIRVRCKACLES